MIKNVLILLSISLFFSSCKKKSEGITVFNLRIKNYIYHEETGGLSGVRVNIWKQKPNGSYKEYVWLGKTGADGKLSYSITDDDGKYEYYYSIDRSEIEISMVKSGIPYPWRTIVSGNITGFLKKNQENNFEITYADLHIPLYGMRLINGNCTDSTDRFRYRKRFMNFDPEWTEWSGDFFGCQEISDKKPAPVYNDYVIYEYEIERNGVVNKILDTLKTTDSQMPGKLYY